MIDPGRIATLIAILMALTLAARALLARPMPAGMTLKFALAWIAIFAGATALVALIRH